MRAGDAAQDERRLLTQPETSTSLDAGPSSATAWLTSRLLCSSPACGRKPSTAFCFVLTPMALSCGRSWRGPGSCQGRDKADCQLERLVMHPYPRSPLVPPNPPQHDCVVARGQSGNRNAAKRLLTRNSSASQPWTILAFFCVYWFADFRTKRTALLPNYSRSFDRPALRVELPGLVRKIHRDAPAEESETNFSSKCFPR